MVVPVLDAAEAFRFALNRVDSNLVPFADIYPDDATHGDVYPQRRSQAGQPAGSNVGWTTGFWPGMIWLAYEHTNDDRYRRAGEHQLASFARRLAQGIDVDHHDLGFLYTPACIAAWRLIGSDEGKKVALQAAAQLMTRFWPRPGIFQAWGRMDDPEQRGRTIIDSLMNMPLLYWASQVSNDRRFHDAAYRHSQQLRDHFVRADNTTYHTFYFDADSGAPRFGKTAQGASDQSCWARGQAWAIYGFALAHTYTKDTSFLQTAARLSDYFIAHLPGDKVAYWDLSYGDGSGEERDSSAAAIAACGMQEIAKWLPAGSDRQHYAAAASRILSSLATGYTSQDVPGANDILRHGVYSKPGGAGVDEGNLWGDYFYMEALMRTMRPDWTLYW